MKDIVVKLELERETKGAVLYSELNAAGQKVEQYSQGKIGNIYLRKDAMKALWGDSIPKNIEITIKVI